MERILNYTISAADEGMIVLDFLRKQGFSRHILTAMKADREALSLNGQKAGGRTVLSCGDHFRVRLLETVPADGILPTPLNIPVLYEDEDILVVNKPADMPVHPSLGNYTNTLANGVAAYLETKGESCPFRCINRLDRDTSGALILAKNALSAAILSVQMRNFHFGSYSHPIIFLPSPFLHVREYRQNYFLSPFSKICLNKKGSYLNSLQVYSMLHCLCSFS